MSAQRDTEVGTDELFAGAPVPMAVAGAEWNLTAANGALASLLGVDAGELAGAPLARWLEPASAAALAGAARDTPPGEGVRVALRLRTAGRGMVHVDLTACPARRGGDAWLLWLHDVTAQRAQEAALAREEARLRRLVEQVPAVLWRADRELRFVFVLGGAVRHWPGGAEGRRIAERMGDEAVVSLQAHRRALAGESVRYETTYRGRVFDCRVEPFRDGDGSRVDGVVGVAVDVTATRAAVQELALRDALLERLFETAPEAIVLLDREGRVLRANPEFVRIFGYGADEVAGRHLDEVLGAGGAGDEQRAILRRVTAGETVRAEGVRQCRDGHAIDVSILATPVHVDAERVGVYAIYRDITEQRRAAAELAGAEAHYRRLVETSPYGIFATDGMARLLEVNEALARILGAPIGELLGRTFTDVLAPESRAAPLHEFTRRMTGQEQGVYEADLVVERPGGERRVVEVRSAPIVEGGRVTGVHGVVRDVTDERARDLHLRRVERLAAVGTLIGGVAHELNNPLSAIRGFAQLLLMDPRGDDDREALELMQREADRAARVVADLRLLARQTQDRRGEYGAVDLNDVVRHVLRLRAYALSTHNVAVRPELAEALPHVLGDRSQLEQVLLNLVVNAEQAMQAAAQRALTVRTSSGPRGVRVEVRDTGPGIAPGDLERVFDAFWTTKPPGEGTGLGLSLVHSMVAEHGGVVHVESPPGAGTRFVVELLRAEEAPAPPPPAAVAPPRRLLRVLVVDDEVAVRRTIARALAGRGHHVAEAGDGGEALRVLDADGAFDVVVADLRMPGLGGDRLLDALRERGGGVERRVVFVTGDAVSPGAARFLARAALPVLEKPFDLRELVARVEAHADAAGE